MLGYTVYFERNSDDLSWWDYSEDENLFFHVEYENSTNKERIIEKTIKKVLESEAEISAAICYLNNEEDYFKN